MRTPEESLSSIRKKRKQQNIEAKSEKLASQENTKKTAKLTKINSQLNSNKPASDLRKTKNSKIHKKSNSVTKVKRPSAKSLALATKQLSSLIKTGVPIIESLVLVAETLDDKNLAFVFKEISQGISKGQTITEMLISFPKVFDDMYVALVDAGEQGGLLSEVLIRESKLLESLSKLKGQILGALAYPIAIFVLVIVVVIVMLTFVMPVFVDMYSQSGTELPAITQMMVDASDWIRSPLNIAILIGIVIGLYLFLKYILSVPRVIAAKDRLLLRLPVVGDLITKNSLASFSRTLSSLTSAGVPLLESIAISKKTMSNVVFTGVVDRLYYGVQVGKSSNEVLSEEPAIPKMFTAMFRIGEETGELGEMVDKLADFYEDEVTAAVKALTSVLEPMMIVIVAGVVALMLVAMYLPMFNMMNTVG